MPTTPVFGGGRERWIPGHWVARLAETVSFKFGDSAWSLMGTLEVPFHLYMCTHGHMHLYTHEHTTQTHTHTIIHTLTYIYTHTDTSQVKKN